MRAAVSAYYPLVAFEAHIDQQGIVWDDYPYPGASVYPSGRIARNAVREVDSKSTPLEIRTIHGETLFIQAGQRKALVAQATAAGVPAVSRVTVWGLLLEPFLDTESDASEKARTCAMLEANGVSRRRQRRIRRRFGPLMMSYNFDSMLWEWVLLGLTDFLDAINGHLVRKGNLVPSASRRPRLYRWTMAVAERAREIHIPEEGTTRSRE